MNDVMLDIETLDIYGTAMILSIGAVEFDIETGKYGREFFASISMEDSITEGYTINASTLLWWFKESEEARNKVIADNKEARNVFEVLYQFAEWLSNLEGGQSLSDACLPSNPNIQMWGRGPRMDLSILANAYAKENFQDPPWNFRNERCVRTMEWLRPGIKSLYKNQGIEHDPIADAKFQIDYVCDIYRVVKL